MLTKEKKEIQKNKKRYIIIWIGYLSDLKLLQNLYLLPDYMVLCN